MVGVSLTGRIVTRFCTSWDLSVRRTCDFEANHASSEIKVKEMKPVKLTDF